MTAAELARTDPEVVAILEGIRTDARRDVPLDARTGHLVRLAALVATGGRRMFREALDGALAGGITPVEVKEVVYQAVPYVGTGRALDALDLANDVLADRGVALPLPAQATVSAESRAADGLAVQKEIVGGDAVDAMYAGAPADEQHVQRYLSAHCFGDHYTRGAIDVPARELVTLALLVALGGADPQVAGHVRANLRVGNDRGTLVAVLTHLLPDVGYPRTLNALRALDDVAPLSTEEES